MSHSHKYYYYDFYDTLLFRHLWFFSRLHHLQVRYHAPLAIITSTFHLFKRISFLTPSANLLQFDIFNLCRSNPHEEDPSEIVVQSEIIREFRNSETTVLTTKFIHDKTEHGRLAFNFMDIRRLFDIFRPVGIWTESLVLIAECQVTWKTSVELWSEFRGTLWYSFSSRTHVQSPWFRSIVIWRSPGLSLPLLLVGLYNELQAMAGHNILEALSFEVNVDGCETENSSILHNVENSLVKPG